MVARSEGDASKPEPAIAGSPANEHQGQTVHAGSTPHYRHGSRSLDVRSWRRFQAKRFAGEDLIQMLTSMPLVLSLLIRRQVQRKNGRQDKQIVLTWSNIHAIRIGERDPCLGDGGHQLIPPPDRVVVLE